MRRNSFCMLVVWLLAAGMAMIAVGPLRAETSLFVRCPNPDLGMLRCDVRLPKAGEISVLSAIWGDGRPVEASFEPNDAGAGASAWFVLVDRMDAGRWRTLYAAKQALAPALASLDDGRRTSALAAFSDTYEELRPPGTPFAEVLRVLGEIEARGGERELPAALTTAIARLTQAQVSRKGLIVISDGTEPPDPAEIERLAYTARAGGISVFALVVPGSGSGASLQRMAELTGGRRVTVPTDGGLPSQLGADIAAIVEGGGTLTVSRAGIEGNIKLLVEAQLTDGTASSASVDLALPSLSYFDVIRTWVAANFSSRPELALIVAVLALLLPVATLATLLFLLLRALKRRRDAREAVTGGGSHLSGQALRDLPESFPLPELDAAPVKACLELVFPDQAELPVDQPIMRIGRHDENDICLKNQTVHRHHAILHRSPEGQFLIRDLGGPDGNGVFINGERTDEHTLIDGDRIELGEVRMIFRISPVRGT